MERAHWAEADFGRGREAMIVAFRTTKETLCRAVLSLEEGRSVIKELAESKLLRKLNDEENESLEMNLEVYNDDGAGNVWSYSVGFVEHYK